MRVQPRLALAPIARQTVQERVYSVLRDLMDARFAIEGMAVARAASNMDTPTLKRLRALIAARSRTDAQHIPEASTDAQHIPEASSERNREFHFTIYARSGSSWSGEMILSARQRKVKRERQPTPTAAAAAP